MSGTTLIVPHGLGYTAVALVSTAYLNIYQYMKVNRARKAAGIAYPQMYAEKAEQASSTEALIFNCTQRAHQNTLESLPYIITLTTISSAVNPIVASTLCGTWVAARFLYTIGYASGDPSKRNTRGGIIGSISLMSLILYSSWAAFKLVQATT